MKTFRLVGAIAALAIACLSTSCYRGTFAWDSYHNYEHDAVHTGPNSPYLVGIDYGRKDALNGYRFHPRPYHSYYGNYGSRTWFDNGYYEGFTTVENVLPPVNRQSQKDAFFLGDEKGRCDRRLGYSPNPTRYSCVVLTKNQDQFRKAYNRGYQREGGPVPAQL
jgi:hypothetical protein